MNATNLLDQVWQAAREGEHALLIEGNVEDRFLDLAANIPPMRLIHALAAKFGKAGWHVARLSCAELSELKSPGSTAKGKSPFQSTPGQPLPVMLQNCAKVLLQAGTPKLLLIEGIDFLVPPSEPAHLSPEQCQVLEIFHELLADDQIRLAGNTLVLIAREGPCHNSLRSGCRIINAAAPDLPTRQHYLGLLLRKPNSNAPPTFEAGFSPDDLARETNGLKLLHLERLLSRNGKITRDDVREVKKRAIFEAVGELAVMVDPTGEPIELVGLESQKETLAQIALQFRNGSRCVPKGILLAGPPGNGKSFSFLWFVGLLGLPGLMLRNLFSKWVGESERNLARLIDVIAALAPCVILIDEIDLFGVGSRREAGENDAGTAGRMGQRFLEWAGSESLRGQVILFGASNRPDRLDAALRDRFPYLIPYLHPATKDLPKLLAGLARSMRRQMAKDVQLELISALPHLSLLTIRGLADIVAQAGMRADKETGTVGAGIQHQHLLAAAQDWKPTHDPLEHEFLALKAVQLTSFRSMLPWMSQQGKRPDAEIPEYLRELLNPAGEVNQGKLGERIRCLEQTLYAKKFLS
jgi:hypothetical protein